MKNLLPYFLSLLLFAGIMNLNVSAQISKKSTPASISQNIANSNFPEIKIATPNVKRLLAEDEFTDKYGIAMRFAVSTIVNIDLLNEGTWMKLEDGTSICRLAISSENAQALILYYSDFYIPEGDELFLYDKTQMQTIGAFSHFNNANGKGFATEMIRGETTVLEYHQSNQNNERAIIKIEEVSYVYRTAERLSGDRGFGGADTCEVNVKCPEGEQWQDQSGGVCRIIVKQGTSSVWCTGSLINNTSLDQKPYLLTADHCGPTASQSDLDQWIFYFRYQGPTCDNPLSDINFKNYTMVGATKIAAAGGAGVKSDFKLLLLNEAVPMEYEPFYNGWSAINETSATGVTIHHPQGDIKKISHYSDPLISSNWGSTPNTHWEVVWAETETNWGVTEGGSSGSPIFNSDGLIIGQLTGGDASCSNLTGPDYYGKISYSWDQIDTIETFQLKPWLDPNNTGTLVLTGITAIAEPLHQNIEIRLYPNPTDGVAFIDFGERKMGKAEISVYDIAGSLTFKSILNLENSSVFSINLSDKNHGVYFVSVLIDDKVVTLKLIR